MAALLGDDSKAEAWPQPGVGQPLVRGVLLPALVWRAGRVPAAARYAALTATATLLAKQRLPEEQLQQLALAVEGGGAAAAGGSGSGEAGSGEAGGSSGTAGLLVLVTSCLDEDYEPDTRQLACHTLQLLLGTGEVVG